MANGLTGEMRELERLVDEYAQADGLDRKRRARLARLIVETADRGGLAREAGVDRDAAPDEALRKIDAWLCDLKDLAIKDGLHVYGRRSDQTTPPIRARCPRGRRSISAGSQPTRCCAIICKRTARCRARW
jgi:cobaltochelatase CobN